MSTAPESARTRIAEPTTPTTNRINLNTAALQTSPHYTTTRRHSLYGTEDRIIIDTGSRVWKAGFSGEGKPRSVFFVSEGDETTLWTLSRRLGGAENDEQARLLRVRLQKHLRDVFHECLLTDPRSRKVIIVEHPLLPLYVKDMIASILFGNLQIPSLSFASSHLLSLFAVGRMTGLVLDCGYLESTVLPIFASRPLFPHLKTTPIAGSRLNSHLRALLLMFGTYVAPLTSLSAAVITPATSRSSRVPPEVLTDSVIEEIKTQCCFVGGMLDDDVLTTTMQDFEDDETEPDLPPSDASVPESEESHNSFEGPASPPSTVLSAPSTVLSGFTQAFESNRTNGNDEGHLQAIATMYSRHSTATDLRIRVDPPPMQQTGTGKGTLIMPGWIRERAAEVLFEGGDVDESSVAEVILDSLLKAPVDLRRSLVESILVAGGTAMLPGFIPRLHQELLRALREPSSSSLPRRHGRPTPPPYDPYAPLRRLGPYIAILNNPSPPPSTTTQSKNAGKAPAFTPACLPWVGGSLAGALKIGGIEIMREKWDEAEAAEEDEDDSPQGTPTIPAKRPALTLPDWTRSPLPPGAPPAPRPPPMDAATPQAAVNA